LILTARLPTEIASTTRRRVSACTCDCSFKIGITCTPEARWQVHKKSYDQIVVVYGNSSIDCVSQLERELTDHNQDLADNLISGGGGHTGKRGHYAWAAPPVHHSDNPQTTFRPAYAIRYSRARMNRNGRPVRSGRLWPDWGNGTKARMRFRISSRTLRGKRVIFGDVLPNPGDVSRRKGMKGKAALCGHCLLSKSSSRRRRLSKIPRHLPRHR
jgi:hypothetical protein